MALQQKHFFICNLKKKSIGIPAIRLKQRCQSQPQTQSLRGHKQAEVSGEEEKKNQTKIIFKKAAAHS